jgi:hypothetical protein
MSRIKGQKDKRKTAKVFISANSGISLIEELSRLK